MELLAGERVLLESKSKTIRLTTHRVRYHARSLGADNVISVALEEVASCGLVRSSYPLLLALAAVSGLAGLAAGRFGIRIGLFIAACALVAYFATRSRVLAIASAGHTIRVSASGVPTEELLQFIDATERAKNERYLLHVPLGVPAPGYTPTRY